MRKETQSTCGETYLVLARLDVDADRPLVNLLGIVVLARTLEDVLQSVVVAVGVLQVEHGHPDVQLLGVLADGDGAQSTLGNLTSLLDLTQLQLEGHVLKPQERGVGLTEQ